MPRLRSMRPWLGLLALCPLLLIGFVALGGSAGSGAPPLPEPLGGGAAGELLRARREQALIRAEPTALMLRALEHAPTLPGDGS